MISARDLAAAALVVGFVVTPISAQVQTQVPVADQSPAGSPLAFTGSVTFWEEVKGNTVAFWDKETVRWRNVSTRSVLAAEIWIRLVYPHSRMHTRVIRIDKMYNSDMIKPGDTGSISAPLADYKTVATLQGPPHMVQPAGAVQLMYLQFADGSEFGDKKYSEGIRTYRVKLGTVLTDIDGIYKAQGSDQFLKALEEPVEPHSIVAILKNIHLTADQDGAAEADAKVQRMIETAKQHRRTMTSSPAE